MKRFLTSDNDFLLETYSLSYLSDGDEIRPSVTEDLDLINLIKDISDISIKIIFGFGSSLTRKEFCKDDSRGVVLTTLGQRVKTILNSSQMRMLDDRNISLSPEVKLFIECANHVALTPQLPSTSYFEALEIKIREEAEKSRIKNLIENHRRAIRKDFASATGYINKIFSIRSRILVIRLDLSYRKDFWTDSKSVSHSYEMLSKDRERLIKSLPSILTVKDSLLGFIWKLEYGPVKSYHYHCMFFLDGSKVRESVTIAKIIGEKWKEITNEEGVYYNCNANLKKYRYCGIGPVNRKDAEARKFLEYAVSYITKPDYYIKAAVPKGKRIFGRGIVTRKMLALRRKPLTRC